LVDLTNTILTLESQNIDNEISASNDYYDQQMELAGNDERQKSLLEKRKFQKRKRNFRKKAKG
jgi:hypothetical protein